MIDLLFNFLLLMFWVRLLPPEQETTYFNPYIAWINRNSRMVLNKLRSGFPQLSQKQLAGMVFFGLIILRAFVMRSMRFGFESGVAVSGWMYPVILSGASFAMVLFYLWTASLILVRHRRRADAMTQCLRFVVRPIPYWPPSYRWMAVFGLGLAISAALVMMPQPAYSGAGWLVHQFLLRIGVNTAAALVDLLAIIQTLLIAAVIGSWMSLLAPSDSLAAFCQDAMALLLGPLRDYRLAIGPLDLTPLLALVALMLLHSILLSLLMPIYQSIMMMGG